MTWLQAALLGRDRPRIKKGVRLCLRDVPFVADAGSQPGLLRLGDALQSNRRSSVSPPIGRRSQGERQETTVERMRGKAVRAAVRRVWMVGEQRLAADGHDRHDPLWRSLRTAIPSRDEWIGFEHEVRAAGASSTLAWLQGTRPLMEHQWAIREKARPHSIGGLETVFQEVVRRLGDRRFVVRNRERLELVFDLMALDLAREASTFRYREIIRSNLLAHAGRPTRTRRALDDLEGSSLHEAIRTVERRLARRRDQNVRAQRAYLERLKEAGKTRARTPSRRPRSRRTGVR